MDKRFDTMWIDELAGVTLQKLTLWQIALGMTNGTFPAADYYGASIKHQQRKVSERIKTWRQ